MPASGIKLADANVWLAAASPSHERWTDAFLAAFAIQSAAQLVTFDQGFKRFAGLDLHLLV